MAEKPIISTGFFLGGILELFLFLFSLLPSLILIVEGVDVINEYMENGYLRFASSILVFPMIFLVNPLLIELLLRIKMTGGLKCIYAYGMIMLIAYYYDSIWNYVQSIF